MAVNIFGYSLGCGMTVLIDTLIRPDGTEASLYSHHDSLAKKCKAFDLSLKHAGANDLAEVYRLVASDIDLYIALNDLVSAITFPNNAAINCARAVEGIGG